MSASQSGVYNTQQFTDMGAPLVGGRLYTYAFGTTTHKAAYTDHAGAIPHTYSADGLGGQFIALDARGELPAPLYLTGGSYDLALKTAAGATVWTRRADPVWDITSDLSASSGASLVGYMPAGVGAAETTVQGKLREAVSVLDFWGNAAHTYKVDPTGVLDSTYGIQCAYNAFGAGGGVVLWPCGSFKWTTAITVPQLVSTQGCGYGTAMYPTGCDGFTYTSSDGIGAVYVRDFYIYGSGSAFTGVKFGDTITDISKRVTGLSISNIIIDNFAVGVRAKNLWHSAFTQVSVNRCPQAVQIIGRSVSVSLISCHLQKGEAPARDTSNGVFIEGFTFGTGGYGRPEAIRLTSETLVYGFNTNVYVGATTSFSCIDCDIDYAVSYGLRAVLTNNGMTIRGNWFAGASAGGSVPVLISMDSVGTADYFPAQIEGNNFAMVGATVGSTAIKINSNRKGLQSIKGNYIENTLDIGVYASYSLPGTLLIEGNTIDASGASLYIDSTVNSTISKNILTAAIYRVGAYGKDVFDNNSGTQTTCYHGPVNILNEATTATIALSTLGLANPVITPPGNLLIKVNAYQWQGGENRGAVRAIYNSAGSIVVTVANAFGSASNDVWIDLEAF